MNERKCCKCDFATTGRCFLKFDSAWRDRNLDHYFKWMNGKHRFGYIAFAQGEARRLLEKGDEMVRIGIDDMRLLDCEIGASPFTRPLPENDAP